MTIARIFGLRSNQTTRMPDERHLQVNQIDLHRREDETMVSKPSRNAAEIFDALVELPADFMPEGRADDPARDRKTTPSASLPR